MVSSTSLVSSKNVFAGGKAFWNNYLKGRPSAPNTFFDRLFRYHEENKGAFETIHDAGAGNGPYAGILRSKFNHVIISDIVSENVVLAKERNGTDGFSYRTAPVENSDGIADGSVDMVFITNAMHFCDQKLAMEVIAKQLKPGGTFACAAFGAACFEDSRVHDIYTRISQTGARSILKSLRDPEQLIAAMARTQGRYNVAPLDDSIWAPGAQRIHLNMPDWGMTSPLPPELLYVEPSHTGLNDVELFEEEEGWDFVTDLNGLREHIESFPFGTDFGVFEDLWKEMGDIVKDYPVTGHWPAKIILATKR